MMCINNNITDAYFNLAAEEYLLNSFPEDVFMLWQNEPSVVIGKHQNVWAEINPGFVLERDIKVVRRFSGGGAVYHDMGNLNLTFIERNQYPDFDKFTSVLLNLLAKIGIQAKADERRGLTLNGFKISGSAQCIHKHKSMFHATLLFNTDLNILTQALQGDAEQANDWSGESRVTYVNSVKSQVTNIQKYLVSPMQLQEFKEIVMDYFLEDKMVNKAYVFSEKDIEAIGRLKKEKYATNEWNFKASLLK